MGKLIKFLLALLVLVIAVALAAPFFIPTDVYKGQIIAAVERSTGRTMTIDGEISLKFFPTAEFTANDVTLSNAEGATDPLMAEMETMTIGVDTRSLLRRDIEVTEFTLTRPKLSLEVLKSQKANWEFESTSGNAQEEPTEMSEGSNPIQINSLTFGDLKIIEGTLTYRNRLTGDTYKLTSVDANIVLPDLTGPFQVKGDLVYQGEEMNIDLALGSLMAIPRAEETTFKLNLNSSIIKANLDGTFKGGSLAKIMSKADVDVPSLRKLAAWAGKPIEIERGFGRFTGKGNLYITGPHYTFADANFTFDDMKASGALTLKNSGAKPAVSGRLTVDKLDIRPYQASSAAPAQGGGKANIKWDETPIDLSALKALDVNFALETKSLFFQNYEIGNADLVLRVRSNKLTAALNNLELYQGTAKGTLSFDVSQPETKVEAGFVFTDVSAGPLLRAASAKDLVEGKGNLSFKVTTSGKTQKALMKNLTGVGDLRLMDGKIIGADLNRMLSLVAAFSPQQAAAEGEEETAQEVGEEKATDFVEMGGTFKIKTGILRTSDFLLENEAVSLTGKGKIDIGRRSINMRLVPGRRQDDGGTGVAIKVQGDWSDIKFAPDFETAIKDKLREALTGGSDRGENDDGDVVTDILESIFGGGGKKN